MRHIRPHRKVWLSWNRWLAIQIVSLPQFALGLRWIWHQGYAILYLGPLTIALGRHPVLSDPRTATLERCRGFLRGSTRDLTWARVL